MGVGTSPLTLISAGARRYHGAGEVIMASSTVVQVVEADFSGAAWAYRSKTALVRLLSGWAVLYFFIPPPLAEASPSVAARTNDEVWVINHVSDTVSIVDLEGSDPADPHDVPSRDCR